MKESITNILGWVLAILFFVGLIIMYGVTQASVFNLTYFMIGALLSGIPALVVLYRFSKSSAEQSEIVRDNKNRFKLDGEKLEIDLTQCEVISSSWMTIEDKHDDYRIQAWNTLGGDSELNVEHKEHHVCRIVCNMKYDGEDCQFISPPIRRDIHTLKMLLEYHKKTNIYIMKANNSYLFETDFLD